jgi:hypothetical protein
MTFDEMEKALRKRLEASRHSRRRLAPSCFTS